MIIDDKGKLFGKISIVDILIVLLIIVATIGGIFSYLNNKEKTETIPETTPSAAKEQMKEIFIDLQLSNIDEYVKNSAVLNDKVYLSKTAAYFGKIVKINSRPHRKEITGTNGMMIFSDVPQKYDITITVIAFVNQTETGYYTADNIHLACGDKLSVKTELLEIDTTIKKVSTEDTITEVHASPQPSEQPDKTD